MGEPNQKETQSEIESFWAGALRGDVTDRDVDGGSVTVGPRAGITVLERPT